MQIDERIIGMISETARLACHRLQLDPDEPLTVGQVAIIARSLGYELDHETVTLWRRRGLLHSRSGDFEFADVVGTLIAAEVRAMWQASPCVHDCKKPPIRL